MYDELEKISIDKIKTQLDNCLFIAFEEIAKVDKNIEFEIFKSYFMRLYAEISIQEANQSKIKRVITEIFNVM